MGGIKRIAVSVLGGLFTVAACIGLYKLGTRSPDWLAPVCFLVAVFFAGATVTHAAVTDD